MNILIIDDDYTRADTIKERILLKSPNSTVIHVDNTSEGKGLLKVNTYDLLILDVILPKFTDVKKAHPDYGLKLLDDIHKKHYIKTPLHIVGITADINSISDFREHFSNYCNLVIEAEIENKQWLNSIDQKIASIEKQKIEREEDGKQKTILTIHGIGTLGSWQSTLEGVVNTYMTGVYFQNYKFLHFPILLFLLPKSREAEVLKFYDELIKLPPEKNLYIFSHSFGTYILAKALEKSIKENVDISINKIVLSGSVLKHNFNWKPIIDKYDCKIVNECGNRDSVLLLSSGFVYGTGMAGRIGFSGFTNKTIKNRFYNFGHSGFFRKEFIKKQWLPLLGAESDANDSLEEEASLLSKEFITPFFKWLERKKHSFFYNKKLNWALFSILLISFLICGSQDLG